MRLAIEAMQQLIKQDGATELKPYLDGIVELFCAKVGVEPVKNQTVQDKEAVSSPIGQGSET